jgi:S1-C subfamily serine protease
MRIDGVTDNKPAFKAGLLKGDVVIKLGELEVTNVQDYMKALSKFKKGDSTNVDVKRGAEIKSFTITF